jgi:hypothetical protein
MFSALHKDGTVALRLPPTARSSADVQTTFIVHVKDGVPQIVFQHEQEDFQQALRVRGVLPAQA